MIIKSTGLSVKDAFIVMLKIVLTINSLLTIFFMKSKYNGIQQERHLHEYEKIKVKVDSTVDWMSGSSSGRAENTIMYYNNPKKGQIVLTYRQQYKQPCEYIKAVDYKESHHDSINIWYHRKYKNYYADEESYSVKSSIPKNYFIIIKLSTILGVIYIIWLLLPLKKDNKK